MRQKPPLRVIAGVVVLGSLALGDLASPYWHLLTAFAGLNLLQSGFTGWCPVVPVLRRPGATPAAYPEEERPVSAAQLVCPVSAARLEG